jgi:hypothetical protein
MRSERILAIAAALIALVAGPATAAAQGGYPGTPMGGERGGGGRPRRPDGERVHMITESQLEGPPAPEFVAGRFELDSTEAAAYKQAYDSFMTATQGQRDSARALRQVVRNAMQAGDRDAARGNFPELQRLSDVLVKAEQQFDVTVKRVLTKNHFKEYQQWKQQQRHDEEQRRPPMERPGPGR